MQTQLDHNIPPQAIEVEQAIISRCLSGCTEAVDLLSVSDFYRTVHQKIFFAIQDLARQEIPIELVSVVSLLKDKGQIEEIGGAHYLAKLLDEAPLAVSVEHYAGILKDKTTLRNLIATSHKIIQACHGVNGNVPEILDNAQRDILKIDSTSGGDSTTPLSEVVIEANDRYESLNQHKGQITGISSGFNDLDRLTCGFQNSDLIICAARPSMGKTALALNMAANMGREGRSSLFFSLEMAKRQVSDRIISSEAWVNGMKFKNGQFNQEDWKAITEASAKVYTWPVLIDDSPSLSYMEIIRRSRRAKKKHNIEIIFIDYLQYVTGDRGQNRNIEIESITRGLKGLAKDLNVPVILLSQLNRKCEERPNPYKRPVLADLRDSGAIEQDADLVLFIYRPERYGEKDKNGNDQKGVAEINIAKHRNGPLGTVRLHWNEKTTRFCGDS